jgi:NTP pyrophosphatase (non-canonical NTP hydrolase)
MTATMGELGEVRDGIRGNCETEKVLRTALAKELADTVIYLDLLAQAAGLDLETIRDAKFDETSRKIGYVESPS